MSNVYDMLQWSFDDTEPCRVPFDQDGRPNDPEKWVGAWTNNATAMQALELCKGCHIIDKCLAYALKAGEKDFIYGGHTAAQRKEMLRAKRQRTQKPDLGHVDSSERPDETA